MATRTLGLLGAIFAWGQENGQVEHNHVRGVKRFADQQEKALLTGEQYRWLALALDALDAKRDVNGERMHSAVGLAMIRSIALTGARRGECQTGGYILKRVDILLVDAVTKASQTTLSC